MQNPIEIKQKILQFFRIRGPALPVHISKEINMSILFTSAFLSELLSEKEIKISNMKVGGSPVYFIPGHEPRLEKFADYLKNKEKEAYLLLKNKKFLQDTKQSPAIRVALRSIRDFAIPFKKQDQIFWRYFRIPESEFTPPKTLKPATVAPSIKSDLKIQKLPSSLSDKKIGERERFHESASQTKTSGVASKGEPISKQLNIFEKKPKAKKTIRKKSTASQKAQDKFFNTVKESLNKKSIEIEDIIAFSKTDLTLKVKKANKEFLLVAFNKKRIDEKDILKTHKKALTENLPYILLSKAEPAKKTTNLIDAMRDLEGIETIE